MRKLALLSIWLALPLALALTGCKTATVAQPLAPGYINAADQQMGELLAGAGTFYNTIKCETQGLNWSQPTAACVSDPNITAPMVLNATAKLSFNDFGLALNQADSVYLAWHAGTATQAAAQAAVTAVQTKQAALPIPGAVQ
jgi:photosystem II stability/assembly factor-like uncharacterized protein